jgi:hypothetical protein
LDHGDSLVHGCVAVENPHHLGAPFAASVDHQREQVEVPPAVSEDHHHAAGDQVLECPPGRPPQRAGDALDRDGDGVRDLEGAVRFEKRPALPFRGTVGNRPSKPDSTQGFLDESVEVRRDEPGGPAARGGREAPDGPMVRVRLPSSQRRFEDLVHHRKADRVAHEAEDVLGRHLQIDPNAKLPDRRFDGVAIPALDHPAVCQQVRESQDHPVPQVEEGRR